MKAVLQLAFVLFYVISGFEASNIRTIDFVDWIQHFGTEGVGISQTDSQQADCLPKYREAKKAQPDIDSHPTWEFSPLEQESRFRSFLDVNCAGCCQDQPAPSRAPPAA